MAQAFFDAVMKAASSLKKEEGPIHVITHLDSDGLTSAAIMTKALKREGKIFVLTVVKQIADSLLQRLAKESYPIVMFLDLGSGNLSKISNILKEKTVYVLDHHQIQEATIEFHINPLLFDLSGQDISGAGVSYLFAKALNPLNKENAHLAILGAIGDMQENKGFSGLNAEILKDATNLEIKNGLRMFGAQTRPLHKILEYSYDPYIPGVTGSEAQSMRFLEETGIPLRENGKYRKLIQLSPEEVKKLITAIILRRLGSEQNPEDIFGNSYLVKDEEDELPTKDLKEFSTLLNCCGRMNKPSLGIGTCLNDSNLKQKAIELLVSYKLEIITALNWFHSNRKNPCIQEEESFILINAEDHMRDTLIGTLCSIISRSGVYKEGALIIGLAHTLDDNTKISVRCVGNADVNAKEILNEITKRIGYEAGGHPQAAGSLIPQEKEIEFLQIASAYLKKRAIEEVVK